ncbi:hypothetical protein HNY73_011874 [Argiope bruennichi]|uniref:Uncharacterized protein n=1 Tax=Argiope bruennichi TaxID=94029 RepID=A0A8T0ET60_ARGBR|nr:hypothetical protein HNY73_011874 [Argiope bruennichi]
MENLFHLNQDPKPPSRLLGWLLVSETQTPDKIDDAPTPGKYLVAPFPNPKSFSCPKNVYSLFPFSSDPVFPLSLLTDDVELKAKDWDLGLYSLESNWLPFQGCG